MHLTVGIYHHLFKVFCIVIGEVKTPQGTFKFPYGCIVCTVSCNCEHPCGVIGVNGAPIRAFVAKTSAAVLPGFAAVDTPLRIAYVGVSDEEISGGVYGEVNLYLSALTADVACLFHLFGNKGNRLPNAALGVVLVKNAV